MSAETLRVTVERQQAEIEALTAENQRLREGRDNG